MGSRSGWIWGWRGARGASEASTEGCKVDGVQSPRCSLGGAHAPQAPNWGRARQHRNPTPAQGFRPGSEKGREPTPRFPSRTRLALTCGAPAISQTARCTQAPGARPPRRGPQCSGRHSFRSFDAFSPGAAVHRGSGFGAGPSSILHRT